MQIFLITLVIFGVAVLGMGLGVLLSGGQKPLKGSCGGPNFNPNCCLNHGEKTSCESEKSCAQVVDEFVPLRSASHSASGHPVATPNHLNS